MKELKPCRHYKEYKAIYQPKCNCIPCAIKYIKNKLCNPSKYWAKPDEYYKGDKNAG